MGGGWTDTLLDGRGVDSYPFRWEGEEQLPFQMRGGEQGDSYAFRRKIMRWWGAS